MGGIPWEDGLIGKPAVMLSSTYKELVEHRLAVRDAMLGQGLFPIAMENDAALPGHDPISASLAKVNEARGYVGLISYRYGQTPKDPERNPEELSLTELEFRRALERAIPVCMFIMSGDHLIPAKAAYEESEEKQAKLKAFAAQVRENHIYAEFNSALDLRAKATQSLVLLRNIIEKELAFASAAVEATPAELSSVSAPPGWEVVDREQLARFRANPPHVSSMVQFFDGILPTWRLALAPGVQPRAIAEKLKNRLKAIHGGTTKPQVVLLSGAGGEGKSTALLHAAAALVEDPAQAWTCLHRQAANAELPEDAFQQLPASPDHAWIIVIDDADNIGSAILAAVKRAAARTDVHLFLAARDAEWQLKRLVPGVWQPFADFHTMSLAGLDREDARRIVAGWVAWGDEAMGKLRGRSEGDAITALLGHARDFAARKEDGELLGALLVTRQGEDMRAHVRTLVNGLGREPAINTFSLRDIYAMAAAMHAENQLYLSRSVLGFAVGCDIDELERKALVPLRREAMLDSGDAYLVTRHRRIAEAVCTVMREDDENIDQWYPFLAKAALKHFHANRPTPEIADWRFKLAKRFVEADERRWPVAVSTAKAVWNVDGENVQSLTALTSILRRVGRAPEAMALLRDLGERYRSHRGVLYEWSTVAGATQNYPLDAWLCGRTLADSREPIDSIRCKLSLAGLGAAFREMFATSRDRALAVGQAACGTLGLELEDLDRTTRGYFEKYVAEGQRNGVTELSLGQAVDAIGKAVILAGNEVEPGLDSVFFGSLLGEPDGYRYTALLQLVGGAKAKPSRDRR